jgi:hypothetical protein
MANRSLRALGALGAQKENATTENNQLKRTAFKTKSQTQQSDKALGKD